MLPSTALAVAMLESPADLAAATGLYPLLDLGISSILVGLIIWFIRRRETLVSSGDWVPKRELDYTRSDRDARLAECERQIERERQITAEYRAAHETSERARELLTGQNRDLIDTLGSLNRFFDSFRAILERIDRDRELRDEQSRGA